jgi:hypothetical protein
MQHRLGTSLDGQAGIGMVGNLTPFEDGTSPFCDINPDVPMRNRAIPEDRTGLSTDADPPYQTLDSASFHLSPSLLNDDSPSSRAG